MARRKKTTHRKPPKQGEKFFHANIDALELSPLDPALQALQAHREVESNSEHLGRTIVGQSSTAFNLGDFLAPTEKTPSPLGTLNYHWQHHLTNLLFCLVFIGLGYMLAEIQQILSHQSSVSGADSQVKSAGGSTKKFGDLTALNFEVISSQVNVRQGPGSRYDVVAQLLKGSHIQGIIVDDRWVKLDQDQFVYRPALKQISQVPLPKKIASLWTHLPQTEVYRLADEKSDRLFSLSYGQQVEGDMQGSWLALDDKGYIKIKELRREQPLVMEGESVFGRVRVRKVPIRIGPDRAQKIVGVFFEGKVVKVTSIEQGWAKIGEQQYLPALFLERFEKNRLSSSSQSKETQQAR